MSKFYIFLDLIFYIRGRLLIFFQIILYHIYKSKLRYLVIREYYNFYILYFYHSKAVRRFFILYLKFKNIYIFFMKF